MSRDQPTAGWNDVWEAVSRYDRATGTRVAADVIAAVAPRYSAGLAEAARRARKDARKIDLPRDVTWAMVNELTPRLEALLPGLYGRRGWVIGNESFGGCLCHSFAQSVARASLEEGVREGAGWVANELDALVECVRAFHAVIDAVVRDPAAARDPAARGARVERAAGELIDVVMARTQCSESWYAYSSDGVRWLLESAGVPLALATKWATANEYGVFQSWVGPPPEQRRSYCAQVGELAMEHGG